ncbi:MAG TPA: PKD domain-containing protein, partial [Thermoanaerobaculia bacterium]
EGHETFLVVLSASVNAELARPEGTGTLLDDDAILISAVDAVAYERHLKTGAAVDAEIVVTLNRASAEEVSVAFATADGTAVAGEDYLPVSGRLVLPPGATSGDALFNPPGPTGLVNTTWESDLHLRHPGHLTAFLTSELSSGTPREGGLPRPGFLSHGPRFATSVFLVGNLFFQLRQSLHDVIEEGERIGGVLVQTYTITNKLPVTTSFDLVRYFECDIQGFGNDGGGHLFVNGREFIFGTDVAGASTSDVAFAGIVAEGGLIPATGRYEAGSFAGFASKIARGEALSDFILRDGADADEFVDAGKGYDIGVALMNRFVDLEPDESVLYRTLTFFGAMPPADFSPDIPPLAVAGRYTTVEGEALVLDASQSFDPDGALAAYGWDLDGDGEHDDASGVQASRVYAQDGRFPIGLRVTDAAGQTSDDQGEVLVINAAPVVAAVPDFTAGEAVAGVLASFSDPGTLDVHTATVDWGEGAGPEPAAVSAAGGSGTVAGVYVYAVPGEYGVTVCVNDDAGATGCDSLLVVVEIGDPELAAAKTDRLADDRDGDGLASPGDLVEYEIVVTNSGTAEATGIVVRDNPPLHTAIVTGSVTTSAGVVLGEDPPEVAVDVLAEGGSVTITFQVEIASPIAPGVAEIVNQATVLSSELPAVLSDDPDVGGDADPTVTMVTAAPRLLAEKTDALAADHDGDGVASPGDAIAYAVTLRNLGNTAATGAQFVDLVPEHTTLVAGSITTTAGAVESVDPLEVSVGELPVGGEVVIAFQVLVDDPVPAGVTEIANQGAVAADGLADVLTDDPDAGGDADPTVTAITAAPVLVVEKSDLLFSDAGGDGEASPGDELLYTITVENTGNTGATAVRLADSVPANAALVPGTVQTSQGTVASEDPVDVDLG